MKYLTRVLFLILVSTSAYGKNARLDCEGFLGTSTRVIITDNLITKGLVKYGFNLENAITRTDESGDIHDNFFDYSKDGESFIRLVTVNQTKRVITGWVILTDGTVATFEQAGSDTKAIYSNAFMKCKPAGKDLF